MNARIPGFILLAALAGLFGSMHPVMHRKTMRNRLNNY
jgi:hypothetical protein